METRSPLLALVEKLVPRLRYPHLFLVLMALFLIDLIVPDALPLVDEVLLGLLTFLVGTWRSRREPGGQPPQRPTLPPDGGE